MRHPLKLAEAVKAVLRERLFTDTQIKNILPRLDPNMVREPRYLEEAIDGWNSLFKAFPLQEHNGIRQTPPIASPPSRSLMSQYNINMNSVLGDVEPDLLLLDPRKIRTRFDRIEKLGLVKNMGEHWIILFNSPRGFYLQDWEDLSKKIYYIDTNIMEFLFEKKELKSLEIHPLLKSASVVEADFDHIRCRFMFANRSGYKALSHLFNVRTALSKPTITDLIMSDDETYVQQFAPFCSIEEYKVFSDLIMRHETDEDDALVYEKLAELNSLTHENTN